MLCIGKSQPKYINKLDIMYVYPDPNITNQNHISELIDSNPRPQWIQTSDNERILITPITIKQLIEKYDLKYTIISIENISQLKDYEYLFSIIETSYVGPIDGFVYVDFYYIRIPEAPHCYWINLDKCIERREKMEAQFITQQIPHTRVVPPYDDQAYKSCIKGHLSSILQAFIDRVELAVFMEDDLIFTNFAYYISWAKYLPSDWDVWCIHYIEPYLIEALDTQPNIILKGYFAGAACYMMNRRGMEKLLKVMGYFNDVGTYVPTFTFDSLLAKSEEFLFRYINGYTFLYPLFNTEENNQSNINTAFEYMNNNYQNMLNINKLNQIPPPEYNKIIDIPYNLHWLGDSDKARIFVENIFCTRKYYFSYLYGDLGECLFQYFSIWGMAYPKIQHDIFSIHPNSQKYVGYFTRFTNTNIYIGELDLYSDAMLTHLLVKQNTEVCIENNSYKKEIYYLPKNKAYIFTGRFQNENYFTRHKETITKLLKEPEWISRKLDELDINWESVCVLHVTEKIIESVNLLRYYIRAIDFINLPIIVLTAKPGLTLYPILKNYQSYYIESETLQLYFMARCKGIICSNATICWWAAYINLYDSKVVTIPSERFPELSDSYQIEI